MGVVGGSVERVDDPAPGGAGPIVSAALLGEHGVGGAVLAQRLDDQRLAGVVHLGHEIDRGALGADAHARFVALALDGARGARELLRQRQHVAGLAHGRPAAPASGRRNRRRALRVVAAATSSGVRPCTRASISPTRADPGRLVALAAQALGREQRSVRLDQQLLERQRRGDGAQAAILLEGEDARERDREAHARARAARTRAFRCSSAARPRARRVPRRARCRAARRTRRARRRARGSRPEDRAARASATCCAKASRCASRSECM